MRELTFIDTPGHEAFTAMRARGAKVTDIAVLVVAADDGVKPQTIEALNHAQAADVPIVVAVNKVDKEGADPAKVRGQLTEYGLVAEEYGGTTMFVDVSAQAGTGLEELLDAILLTTDAALELLEDAVRRRRRASRSRPGSTRAAAPSRPSWSSAARCASATRSSPATPSAASAPCSTSAARTSQEADPGPARPGARLHQRPRRRRQLPRRRRGPRRPADRRAARRPASATPCSPRSVAGRRSSRCSTASRRVRTPSSTSSSRATCPARSRPSRTRCSRSRSSDEVSLRIIHRGVGAITENDVTLASASDAVILGFNVRAEGNARDLADREHVDVRYYSVIYAAIEDVEAALKGMLKPEYEEVQLGTAEVREVFRVPKIGNIAGSIVRSGLIRRNTKARLRPRRRRRRRQPQGRVAASLQGRRDRGPRGLRVRYRAREVQRHQDRATSSRPGRCGRSRGPSRSASGRWWSLRRCGSFLAALCAFRHHHRPPARSRSVPACLGPQAAKGLAVFTGVSRARPAARGRALAEGEAVGRAGRSWRSCGASTRCAPPRRVTWTCTGGRWSGWRSWPPTRSTAGEVLDACERLVADRPEVEVLSAHQQLFKEEDD